MVMILASKKGKQKSYTLMIRIGLNCIEKVITFFCQITIKLRKNGTKKPTIFDSFMSCNVSFV